jgi:hypothetical protein
MQSGNNTSTMTRYDKERNSGTRILNIAEVVETQDIVGCTVIMSAWEVGKVEREGEGGGNLPNQVTAIRHSSDRTHWTTSTRKFECALRSGHLETFVKGVFFDCAVPSTRVDCVAVDGPAGTHAPRRYTWRRMYYGDGAGNSLIPYAHSTIDGGVEEGCGGSLR